MFTVLSNVQDPYRKIDTRILAVQLLQNWNDFLPGEINQTKRLSTKIKVIRIKKRKRAMNQSRLSIFVVRRPSVGNGTTNVPHLAVQFYPTTADFRATS